jgi:hypothetical protein
MSEPYRTDYVVQACLFEDKGLIWYDFYTTDSLEEAQIEIHHYRPQYGAVREFRLIKREHIALETVLKEEYEKTS